MMNCVIDLWQLCRSFAIAIRRLSLIVKADNVLGISIMLCLCRSLGGLERFSQRRISQKIWETLILGITVLNLVVVTVKWRQGQFKYQWRCWTPLHGGDSRRNDSSLRGEVMSKEARRPSAVLQLVWHCDRAVLFVDVLYFFTPCEGRDLSSPGIVHHFVLVWSCQTGVNC